MRIIVVEKGNVLKLLIKITSKGEIAARNIDGEIILESKNLDTELTTEPIQKLINNKNNATIILP